MKKFIHSHRTSLVGLGLLAALGASAFATAQPAPPGSDTPTARMVEDSEALRDEHLAMRAERRVAREAGREARLEGRIAFMRTRLGITDAQAPLWGAFAESLRNNRLERVAARPGPRDPDAGRPPLVERLERQQEMLAARANQLNATIETLTPLYQSFDDEQRRTADRVFRRVGNNGFAMRGQRGERNRSWRGGARREFRRDRSRGPRGSGQGFEAPPQEL
jgi:hypothetical protein